MSYFYGSYSYSAGYDSDDDFNREWGLGAYASDGGNSSLGYRDRYQDDYQFDYGPAYAESGTWSDTSGASVLESSADQASTLAVLCAPDDISPGEEENVARGLLSEIKDSHTGLDLVNSAHHLGYNGTAVLLAGVRKKPARWESFAAGSEQLSVGITPPYNPLPAFTDTLLLLPNLITVELGFHINAKAYPSLVQVLRHPKVETLALTGLGFEADLLRSFLGDFKTTLPTSSIRHLSLAGLSVPGGDDLYPDVKALLETGRAGGLEYLDLGDLSILQLLTDGSQLVDEIEKNNPTLIGIRLTERDRSRMKGAVGNDYARLKAALKRNRQGRAETHATALRLLPISRTLFHRPLFVPREFAPIDRSGRLHHLLSGITLLDFQPTSFKDLPAEILLDIIGYLGTGPLTARQLTNVIEYAADRGTLKDPRSARSGKEFLDKVDCWKWDGIVGQEDEAAAA